MNNINTKLSLPVAKLELFGEIVRSEVERVCNELLVTEMSVFLDYEKYDRAGFNTGNSRNGFYERSLVTEYGEINLKIPRDRNGEFEQQLFPKHQRRTEFVENMIINLYQVGMTTAEIAGIIERLYGHHYTPATISNITHKVIENINLFKNRKLEQRYSVIYLDATYQAIRRDTVAKEAIHIAIGITLEGNKEVLGYKIAPQESALIWRELLSEIRERGTEEVLLFVTDGLSGIETVIEESFPQSEIQRCLVHIGRNINSKVRVKDRAEVMEDFKKVYRSKDLQLARIELQNFINKWKNKYQKVGELLQNQQHLLTFFSYPESIRSSIYTTNLIEGFNKQLKRKTKRKEQFPNEESLEKFLVTIFSEYNSKFGNRVHKGFGLVQAELLNKFEQRY